MKITGLELANIADDLYKKITKSRKIINSIQEEKQEENSLHNLILKIPETYDVHLLEISIYFKQHADITIYSEIVNIIENQKSGIQESYQNFEENIQNRLKNKDRNPYDIIIHRMFTDSFKNMCDLVFSLYDIFFEKCEVRELIEEKGVYEGIVKRAMQNQKKLNTIIENSKKRADEILLKMEQCVAEKKITDIKEYYDKTIKSTQKKRNTYAFLFYGLSFLLVLILIKLFLSMETFYQDNFLLISKSILSFTIIGFLTFIINDSRKRLNISQNILDELNQKQMVVDAYSSLLARIQDFDDETKKKYHEKIIQNIIDTLLQIRNHGYLSKSFNNATPSPYTRIIEELSSIMQK